MDTKFAILLLLVAAAQSSLAQNTSKSCVGSTTTIASDLAKITYGEETSTNGLRNMEDAIYHEIISILAEKSSRHIRRRNSSARFELAKKKAFDNLLVGIEPTLVAIKVFQPDTDVPSLLANSTIVCQAFIDLIFSAINLTMVATNYTATQAGLATHVDALVPLGTRLIQGLYGAVLTGTKAIPDASIPVTGCVAVKAKSHILSAIARVGDQISILLDAIFNIGTEDAGERIRDIHEEARTAFDTEVRYKYSIIRLLVVGEYLKNSGDIVTGLFNLQSIVPGYTSI